jgi:hypothetical protein
MVISFFLSSLLRAHRPSPKQNLADFVRVCGGGGSTFQGRQIAVLILFRFILISFASCPKLLCSLSLREIV